MKLAMTWDLERFYAGGSHSTALEECFEQIEAGLHQLDKNLKEKSHLPSVLELLQVVEMHLRQVSNFAHCLVAQNDRDTRGLCTQNRAAQLCAFLAALSSKLDEWLLELDEKAFQDLIEDQQEIAFPLSERRRIARSKLPAKEEGLISALAVDGYQGWTDLWNSLIRSIAFPHRGRQLAFNQIEALLEVSDREERREAFQAIEQGVEPLENTFAQALNHLAGFRLKVYEERGWKTPLQEALMLSRLDQKTLDVMWETTEKNQQALADFLQCKAALLGQEKLHWSDLSAPALPTSASISYQEASSFMVKHFSRISPKFAGFVEEVLQDHWIDAENRPGKSPGGFCTAFPLNKESRIFMTYLNTTSSLLVLAHELGHAFHNSVLFPLPEMTQRCPMNLAETASTMSEMMILRAAIDQAEVPAAKLSLLENHLNQATSYVLNIRSRFLFERAFYEERQQGFVPAGRLRALMQQAQEESFQGSLASYHPFFWATKMHFFLTDVPFYNFPYTFGYLFSLGIYALASHLPRFEERFIALLKESGQASTEALAQKHLDVDLKEASFWQMAFDVINKDSATFCALADAASKETSLN